ncbi:MAG: hypothetical protein ACLQIS_15755 [Bryobacteraceae bacterium]
MRRLAAMVRAFTAEHGMVVRDGPFQGMRLTPDALNSLSMPKLLGCYEMELHPFLGSLRDYAEIVNIGCAEGYYAVGLARRFPDAVVYAFDTLPEARRICSEVAEANGVAARVIVRGTCDLAQLRQLAPQRPFLLCNCEGAEYALVRPDAVPWLRHCDILVELHQFEPAQVPEELIARFAHSHTAATVRFGEADRMVPGLPDRWPPADRRLAVREFRCGGLQWAFLSAKVLGERPSTQGGDHAAPRSSL